MSTLNSSSVSASPTDIEDPVHSSIFLSTFIPILIVAAYTIFAAYKLYNALSRSQGHCKTAQTLLQRAWRGCTGWKRGEGYIGVADTDAIDDEGVGDNILPLTYIPIRATGKDCDTQDEDDQQLQQCHTPINNNPLPPPPPTITVNLSSPPDLEPSTSHSRRKSKPPPLSLRTWPRSRAEAEEAAAAGLNIARFFNGDNGTGQLRDDIILRPSTGLETICVHVPKPERRGRWLWQTDYIVEWIDWVVDMGVSRVLKWLESGSVGVGEGEYQKVPDDDSPDD